jgi:hypothetical protein
LDPGRRIAFAKSADKSVDQEAQRLGLQWAATGDEDTVDLHDAR